MRKRWGIWVLFLLGFLCCCLPLLAHLYSQKEQEKVIATYQKTIREQKRDVKELRKQAEHYNSILYQTNGAALSGEDALLLGDASYASLLDTTGTGVMGSLDIPKIGVELPIYHGTSEAVLQAGVGHFWGTSLPVGGESTHTVLTGHRGLPTKTLFTNMDKLEVGDIFYIKVLDETLAYQIDQILTVLPQETDSLSIEPGKDYATLVTCTPFAINTHRLLVRGERIPYEEATKQEPDTNIKPELSFTAKVLIVTIIVIFIGLMIAVIYSIRDRKRRKVR